MSGFDRQSSANNNGDVVFSKFKKLFRQFLEAFFALKRGYRFILLVIFAMPFLLFSLLLFVELPRISTGSICARTDCDAAVAAALAFERATLLPAETTRNPSAAATLMSDKRPLTLLDEVRSENRRLQAQLDSAQVVLLNATADCREELVSTKKHMEELKNKVADTRNALNSKTTPIISELENSLANVTALYQDMTARYKVAIESASCNNHEEEQQQSSVSASDKDDKKSKKQKQQKPLDDSDQNEQKSSIIVAKWLNKTSDPPTWQGTIKDLKYYDNTINELASRQRFREMLGERWIFIYGDSTSRVFFNTLLDAVGAPRSAQLTYGDVCSEFMDNEDSRAMCLCRVLHSEKDWHDDESRLRISYSWKEQMFGDKDRRLFELKKWFNNNETVSLNAANDTRKEPDVMIVNTGYHALHLFSADENVVFRGANLTAALLLRYASESDQFTRAVRQQYSGCRMWRATNHVSRERRLHAQLFDELNAYTVPLMRQNGWHALNATAQLTVDPPFSYQSDDGFHYERIAPIVLTLFGHAVEALCPLPLPLISNKRSIDNLNSNRMKIND